MTSEQVLATLIAHVSEQHELLGRQLDALGATLHAIKALTGAQPAQGRVLATLDNREFESWSDIARAINGNDYDKLMRRLIDCGQLFYRKWERWEIDGTINAQATNAVLTLALGPDAPQFTATGEGWELRTNE